MLSAADVWGYATRTLTDPDSYKADVSSLALETTLSTHDTDIKTLFTALNNLSDAEVWAYATRTLTSHIFPFTNPASALDVSNIRTAAYTLLTDNTYGLSAIETLIDEVETLLKGSDESGSFNWDTSVNTTTEVDISALFTTALTGTTRRKYAVYLDLTGPEGDAAAWTECTIKLKIKIDGANYRTIDKKVIAKTDVASTSEPGIPIDILAIAQDCQITMQFDVALDSDQTIYYHYAKKVME